MQKTQAYYYGGETNLWPTKIPLVHACLGGIHRLSQTAPWRSDKNYESTWKYLVHNFVRCAHSWTTTVSDSQAFLLLFSDHWKVCRWSAQFFTLWTCLSFFSDWSSLWRWPRSFSKVSRHCVLRGWSDIGPWKTSELPLWGEVPGGPPASWKVLGGWLLKVWSLFLFKVQWKIPPRQVVWGGPYDHPYEWDVLAVGQRAGDVARAPSCTLPALSNGDHKRRGLYVYEVPVWCYVLLDV